MVKMQLTFEIHKVLFLKLMTLVFVFQLSSLLPNNDNEDFNFLNTIFSHENQITIRFFLCYWLRKYSRIEIDVTFSRQMTRVTCGYLFWKLCYMD